MRNTDEYFGGGAANYNHATITGNLGISQLVFDYAGTLTEANWLAESKKILGITSDVAGRSSVKSQTTIFDLVFFLSPNSD